MKLAITYLVFLTLIMGAALAYGFVVGDFWKDGGELMDNPWGIVSLFDVYVGFFFFYWLDCLPRKLSGYHSWLVSGYSFGWECGRRYLCDYRPLQK